MRYSYENNWDIKDWDRTFINRLKENCFYSSGAKKVVVVGMVPMVPLQ